MAKSKNPYIVRLLPGQFSCFVPAFESSQVFPWSSRLSLSLQASNTFDMYFPALALFLALAPLGLATPLTSDHIRSIEHRAAPPEAEAYGMPEDGHKHNGTHHEGDHHHHSKNSTDHPNGIHASSAAAGYGPDHHHNGSHHHYNGTHRFNGTFHHNGTHHHNGTGHHRDQKDPMRRWQSAATPLDYSSEAPEKREPNPDIEAAISDITQRSELSRLESRKPLNLRARTLRARTVAEGALLDEEPPL